MQNAKIKQITNSNVKTQSSKPQLKTRF